MPLVNGRILLNCIQEKHVLAGAFNTTNLETTISILNAIERSGLPNFIQLLLLMHSFQVTITFMKLLSGMPTKWMFLSACIWIMGKLWKMLSRLSGPDLPQ